MKILTHDKTTIRILIRTLSNALKACPMLAGKHCLLLTLLCVATTSCLILPVKQVRGVSGKAKSQDYSFVKEGVTTREEVIEKLGWMDSGIHKSRLFWGRWSSSGKMVLIGGPDIGVADYTSYKTRNLLMEFDERRIVRSVRLVNEYEIAGALIDWCKRSGECPVSQQTINSVNVRWLVDGNNRNRRWTDATLRVGADSIHLFEATLRIRGSYIESSRSKPGAAMEIPRNNFRSMSIQNEKSNGYPGSILISITYVMVHRINNNGTPSPPLDRITLQISPRDFYTLLKYIPSSQVR